MLKVEWNAKEIKGNTLNACVIFYSHGEKKKGKLSTFKIVQNNEALVVGT